MFVESSRPSEKKLRFYLEMPKNTSRDAKNIALVMVWIERGQDSGTRQEAVRITKELDDDGLDQICNKGHGKKQMNLQLRKEKQEGFVVE